METIKIMKLANFRTFLVFVCSIGLISYVIAGPGSSSDHGRGSGSGPGFGPSDNPGQSAQNSSDDSHPDSQNNPGKDGSQFGRSTASDAGSNGSLHENSAATGRGDEKMIDTGDKAFENESTEKSGDTDQDKTFKASLMDTGISPAPGSSAAESHGSNATTHAGESPNGTPPGHHYGWEKGKHNPHRSPSPSASPSASASATATATATASATPSATATP